MKRKKPPITEYPGNTWLAEKLQRHKAVTTVPFFHGVVRGALANPFPIDPAEAMAEAFNGCSPSSLPQKELEYLTLAFLYLWNDTGRSYQNADCFPAAVVSDIRTEGEEKSFLEGTVNLVEGFKIGFALRKPPKGVKLDRTRTWLRDMGKEAGWCRRQIEESERFRQDYPNAKERKLALETALDWIEECMGWACLYARMDVEGKGGAPRSIHRESVH